MIRKTKPRPRPVPPKPASPQKPVTISEPIEVQQGRWKDL